MVLKTSPGMQPLAGVFVCGIIIFNNFFHVLNRKFIPETCMKNKHILKNIFQFYLLPVVSIHFILICHATTETEQKVRTKAKGGGHSKENFQRTW
jgi:hypothetical protein